MTLTPQPEVFLTPESHKLESQKKRRPILKAILTVLILTAVIFGIIYYRNQIQKNLLSASSNLKTKILTLLNTKSPINNARIIDQGKMSDLLGKSRPALFYADLEYDPKTGVALQKRTGSENGDPILLPNILNISNDKFAYKVEVSSTHGIIESGWGKEYKEIAQTKDGKINFRITVNYQPKAMVRVYLSDKKLIWTGKMP